MKRGPYHNAERRAWLAGTGPIPLCRRCGIRPCHPAGLRAAPGWYYECSRCIGKRPWRIAYDKRHQRRKWAQPHYREYGRERDLARRNPLRAAYRAIGLEQYNLRTKGRWR